MSILSPLQYCNGQKKLAWKLLLLVCELFFPRCAWAHHHNCWNQVHIFHDESSFLVQRSSMQSSKWSVRWLGWVPVNFGVAEFQFCFATSLMWWILPGLPHFYQPAAWNTQLAGPKITLRFPCLYLCVSAFITCAIIMSRTSLPCMRPCFGRLRQFRQLLCVVQSHSSLVWDGYRVLQNPCNTALNLRSQ